MTTPISDSYSLGGGRSRIFGGRLADTLAPPPFLGLGLPAPFGVVPFDAAAEFPTPEQISIYAPLTRPVAAGTVVRPYYRREGDLLWRPAFPMQRSQHEFTSYVINHSNWIEYFGGVIFDLEPGSTYQVLLVCYEPGRPTSSIAFRAVTRALPAAAGAPNKFATPADDLQAAIFGLQPGDVLQLANGVYGPASGAAYYAYAGGTVNNPVYIRGESRDGVIVHAPPGDTRIFQLRGMSHVVFENMTLQSIEGCWRAVEMHSDWSHTHVTFRDLKISAPVGITGQGNATGVLYYNNISDGGLDFETTIATNLGWNAHAVQLGGTGHCVFDCDLRGHGDTIHHSEGASTASNFLYRCKVRDACDDGGGEWDYTLRNCGTYDLDIANSATAISLDYTGAGPYYYFRNWVINCLRGPLKLNSTGSNFHIVSNSLLRRKVFGRESGMYTSGGSTQRYYSFVNNILAYMGGSGRQVELDSAGHAPLDFTHNAFYPDGSYEFADSVGAGTLAEYAANGPTTPPLFGNSSKRLANCVVLGPAPFSPMPPLTDSLAPVTVDSLPVLVDPAALNTGLAVPNITDGFSGAAPDMGAVIRGRPFAPRGYAGRKYPS